MRVADGKTKVLDGPYAETKEQLGGYYMIDVPDLDAALSWAARCPGRQPRRDRGASDLAHVGRASRCREKTTQPARATAEAVARRSYGKLVAFLAARTRDVAGAEDALSDAFAAALADWPRDGMPEKPGGLADGGGAAQADRRRPPAAQQRGVRPAHLRLIAEELEAATATPARFPTTALR